MEREVLSRWLCGEENAVELVTHWFGVFHAWDDIKDGDPIPRDHLDEAMWTGLVAIPNNPFFVAHRTLLTGALATAILEWHAANKLESTDDDHDLEIAYTLRCNVLGLVQLCALLTGGYQHALEVGPEIRRYGQRETLAEYVGDLRCQTSSEASVLRPV